MRPAFGGEVERAVRAGGAAAAPSELAACRALRATADAEGAVMDTSAPPPPPGAGLTGRASERVASRSPMALP